MTPPSLPQPPLSSRDIITLLFLCIQVVVTFGLAAYYIEQKGNYISGIELFLSGMVMAWWTWLFGRLLRGNLPESSPFSLSLWEKSQLRFTPHHQQYKLSPLLGDGVWRSLEMMAPVLTTGRVTLWLLVILGALYMDINPLTVLMLAGVWGCNIYAVHQMYMGLLRLTLCSDQPRLYQHLSAWLNTTAAFSVGMMVFNITPIAKLSEIPSTNDILMTVGTGFIEVTAFLLARWSIDKKQEQLDKQK